MDNIRHAALHPGPNVPLWTEGLVCQRWPEWAGRADDPVSQVALVNVEPRCWPWGRVAVDWCGEDKQLWTLSLNVLNEFGPESEFACYKINGVECWVWPRAVYLYALFAEEIIRPIPFWGGRVGAPAIRAWLDKVAPGWGKNLIDLAADFGGGE